MKRTMIVITMLALLLVAAPATFAASTITINSLGVLSGSDVTLEYETRLPSLGTQMTLSVKAASRTPNLKGYDNERATGFSGGVRYYLDGRAHDGVYLGGLADVTTLRATRGGADVAGTVVGLIGTGGYKWIFPNRLVVDVGAGLHLPLATHVSKGTMPTADLSGAVGTSLHVGVGYAF